MGNLGFNSWEGHELQDNSRGRWSDPSDSCLKIQKSVNKINDRLEKNRLAKHTYVKDGLIPYKKEED